MNKIFVYFAFFFVFIGWHYYKVSQVEKNTACEIIDALRGLERQTEPDVKDENTGIMYYSPIKYAKRTTVMDCENLIYEKYRLWE